MEETGLIQTIPQPTAMQSWEGAAERGLQARHEREAIIARVLKPKLDYGIIPGTKKPTLLKAGAEKIIDCLNLYADYERIGCEERWDSTPPLFAYTYRCTLRLRGSGTIVATGIGSCNSWEGRYRWRNTERICPACKAPAIIKGKTEYGGGWVCFKKKGGCNAKFKDGDQAIESQQVGRVENDDMFTLVNTIDKMSQKRALVASGLNLGFSEHFTQDMEDFGPDDRAQYDPDMDASEPSAAEHAAATEASSKKKPTGGTWEGTLKEVSTREGETNKKPWTLVTITADDGTTFNTFDKKLGLRAAEAIDTGCKALIQFKFTAKGGKDVQTIELLLDDLIGGAPE